MAITRTQRGSALTTTNGSSVAVTSVALTVDKVYVIFIQTSIGAGTAATVSSVAGTGLSATKKTTTGDAELFDGDLRRLNVWYGKCTASGTVTVTATYSGNSTSQVVLIEELDGVDTGGTNGANAIGQAVIDTQGAATSLDIAGFSAFSSSDNRPMALCVHSAQEATSHDSGGGYSELNDANFNNPASGICFQWHSSSADTAPGFSWATSSNNGGIAVELVAAAAGSTGGPLTGGKLTEPSLLVRGRLAS